MDMQSANRLALRARKRLAHAALAKANATSERAIQRHERRERNARRALKEAARESLAWGLMDA